MMLFLAILSGIHVSLFNCLFCCSYTVCMHVQRHSEHDPSHVEDGDDRDSTSHQEMPVGGKVAAPSQSLEVTIINILLL